MLERYPKGDWDYQFRKQPVVVPETAIVIEWEPGVTMTWTGTTEVEWADG